MMQSACGVVLVGVITFASVLASAFVAEKQQARVDLLMQETRGPLLGTS